jgi:hypothetical protein
VQIEYGLAPFAYDVHVRRPVIVRIDHGAQAAEAKDRRHGGL